MLERPEIWMRHALESAARSAEVHGEVPVGAVLIHEGNVIGEGVNTRLRTERTVGHAEIMALEAYNQAARCWRLPPGTSLVVTVEPCLMCTGAMLWARVDHIYFGCSDPRTAGIQKIEPLIAEGVYDHRFKTIEGGILGDECSLAMKRFFSQMRVRRAEEKAREASSPL